MKKHIIIYFIFFCKACLIFAQQQESSISIKGYYFTKFLKSEVSFYYAQKIEKEKKESYSTPIDFTQYSFFIPTEIGQEKTTSANDISQLVFSENGLNKDTLYFIPNNNRVKGYIKQLFSSDIDLSKAMCIFSEVGRLSPYYIERQHQEYIYKCVYLEGNALKKIIPNVESERVKLFIDVDKVNRKSTHLCLYFLTEIDFYTSVINVDNFEEWYPYIDKKYDK